MSGVKSSVGGAGKQKKQKRRKVYMNATGAVKNMESRPSVQVISKKINVQKLIEDNYYYHRKEKAIEKEVNKNADIIIIDLKTDKKIEEMWVMELLLYLQSKFSDVVVIPKSDIPEKELQDWFNIIKPDGILRAC